MQKGGGVDGWVNTATPPPYMNLVYTPVIHPPNTVLLTQFILVVNICDTIGSK